MRRYYKDKVNNFMEIFDDLNGLYIRTGILEERDGKLIDTNVNPFKRDFPALLDIGVMGHCVHGSTGLCIKSGVECYQNGLHIRKENMPLDNYKKIIDQCKGKLFQIALGGRGDVDQHENFEELLKYTRENGIVPNFTSSGLGFNDRIAKLCKQYCGAVAISWYRSSYTLKAIDLLIQNQVTTNIHYVLSKSSIDEAIDALENDKFPKGISAVIFLLHKPIGLGSEENVLEYNDPRLQKFFHLVDNNKCSHKIGFDSCTIPGVINFCHNINIDSLDTCEAGRFSAYVDSDMNMMPCSFDNQDQNYAISLNTHSVKEVWDSNEFEKFRNSFRLSCLNCKDRTECYGGCPITNKITLCNRKERQHGK